jgi:hypothetical protein
MKKSNASPRLEQDKPFIAKGSKGTDWQAVKPDFIHLAKIGYDHSVSQCNQYITNDDMRDPDATIDSILKENLDPIFSLINFYENNGMPIATGRAIRKCDWLRMTRADVINDLSADAQKMRLRKIYLRQHRADRRKNGNAIIVD